MFSFVPETSQNPQELLKELGIESSDFQTLLNNSLLGIALCKILYVNGVPSDMVTLEVNQAYEKIFDVKREQVIGKKSSELNHKAGDKNLLVYYSKVALSGVPQTFEILCKEQNKWYQTYVYSPKKEYFITCFFEITEPVL